MSAGDSKQYTVEDIKTELRVAVRQLGELAHSDTSFDDFCETLLGKLVKLTGGHGAVLWQAGPAGSFQITHKKISPDMRIDINESMHRDAVKQVIHGDQPVCIESETLREPGTPAKPNASECFLLMAPVVNRKRENFGTLELLQRRNISEAAQEGYLKFLVRIAELFQRWHEFHDLEKLSYSADQHSSTMDFVTEIHKSIDLSETAYAIANEARRVMKCDRVSFAKWNGSSCKVTAVSSQDRFDNRANVVRKLGRLATASVAGNIPIWVTGDTEGLPPEIVKRLNDYMDEAHSRTLAVVPLLNRPNESVELEFKPSARKKPKKMGALILEYFDEDVSQDRVSDSMQLVALHSEIATANALEHEQIFMRPLWKRMGQISSFLFRDHFAKTMTGLAALALLVLYMIFIPTELEMRVNGVIQPEVRRNIFSQADGVASIVHVDQGEKVKSGQLLIELSNADLEMGIEEARGQLVVTQQRIRESQRQLSRMEQLPEADAIALMGRESQLRQQLVNLETRLKLMEKRQSRQSLVSPIDGTIVTWDAKNRLTDLPISTNQFVLAVADFDGPWVAELRIPQNQVGYVVAAMDKADEKPLHVEFRVATNPNIEFTGELIRLADRTDPGDTGVPEFRAIVKADIISKLEDVRPGAGLTARIHCGQRSSGFVWFYQVIDWLRMNAFF